jgi:hypothetical protein
VYGWYRSAALLSMSEDLVDPASGKVVVAKKDWASYGLQITSDNNFPTAAGWANPFRFPAFCSRFLLFILHN